VGPAEGKRLKDYYYKIIFGCREGSAACPTVRGTHVGGKRSLAMVPNAKDWH
jgi:hypothetical protein